MRLVALVGTYLPIEDTNPHSPAARDRVRESIHESLKDTDGDGIPDDIDACPTEPEDHKDPDPNDGCPAPSDRDGDGIPDQFDKCPDEPEDKDGIQDQDGCPEVDADNDGIPDTKDACPKEPGQPDPDPKKNGCPKFIKLEGSTVRVLQQVHFATGSATIEPDSFPMLGEIAALLKANPSIKKMRIEGHTDNRGNADYNLDLSKRRAASVRTWLEQHGIEGNRLESEGYGLTRPIETNDTEEGRLANRRVEFKNPRGRQRRQRRSLRTSREPCAPARLPQSRGEGLDDPRFASLVADRRDADAIEVAPQHVRPVRGARPQGSMRERHGRRVGDVFAERSGRESRVLQALGGVAVAGVVGQRHAPAAMRRACSRATASSRASRASGGSPLDALAAASMLANARESSWRPSSLAAARRPHPARARRSRARAARRRRRRSPRRRVAGRSRSSRAPAP